MIMPSTGSRSKRGAILSSLHVIITLLLLACLGSSVQVTKYGDVCKPPAATPTSTIDPSLEHVLTSEEELTGHRCFSLSVVDTLIRNTVHLSVLRNEDTQFCSDMVVNAVEFLAVGFSATNEAESRPAYPIGNIVQGVTLTSDQVCTSAAGKSFAQLHFLHTNQTAGILEQCKQQPGQFHSEHTSSLLFTQLPGKSDSLAGSGSAKAIVACALWQYKPQNREYPSSNEQVKDVEFIAQLAATYDNHQLYRHIVRRSYPKLSSILELQDIKCKKKIIVTTFYKATAKTTTTTTTTTTTECPDASETPPPITTPPPPIWVLHNATKEITVEVDCSDASDCSVVSKYFRVPELELPTSMYDSVSDGFRCYTNELTAKKYKFGGFDYGFTAPASQLNTDKYFKDCLQFRFDPKTNCAIFTLKHCDMPQVDKMTLEEFTIFALATSDSKSPYAEPFGTWERVDIYGNCGNLINNRASPPRRELIPGLFEEVYERPSSSTPTHLLAGVVNKHHMLKISPSPIPILQTSGPAASEIIEDSVIAVRFKANEIFRPSAAEITKIPKFINFVLEAYAKITAVGNQPGGKFQLISMKTPIMEIKYDVDGKQEHRISEITPRTQSTHDTPYFQLAPYIHDELYHTGGICPKIMNSEKGIIKPRVPPSFENTCYCYTKVRSSASQLPITVQEFVAKINKPGITEKCFVFSYYIDGSCKSEDGFKMLKVLLCLGLTCTGKDGLEISDFVFQANNHANNHVKKTDPNNNEHRGHPVGNWKSINYRDEAVACRDKLKSTYEATSGANRRGWKIRKFKPVSHHLCPAYAGKDDDSKNLKHFFQINRPEMLFFNHNLTFWTNDTENYGGCSWWYFKYDVPHLLPDDAELSSPNKDFYFEIQFVASALTLYRPGVLQEHAYVVGLKTEKLGINLQDCKVDEILKPSESNRDIFLSEYYYNERVQESKQDCILPHHFLIQNDFELCRCFVGKAQVGVPGVEVDTHRAALSELLEDLNDEHSLFEAVSLVQACLSVSIVEDMHFQAVIRFHVIDAVECKNLFWFYEVVFQAINDKGMPMGRWGRSLVTSGAQCGDANRLGEAQLDEFPCPFDRDLQKNYRTKSGPGDVSILRFKNRWQDDGYTDLCVTWKYPADYVTDARIRDKQNQLPSDIQFFAHANVWYYGGKIAPQFLTSPRFTLKKIKFSPQGNFNERVLKQPVQIREDFNTRLDGSYNKGPDCILPYPDPPLYRSYSCLMFHPSDKGGRQRMDLDDPKDTFAKPFIDAGCFTFDAFPGNNPLTMHLRFRQKSEKALCSIARGINFAFTAYNELGFPVGQTEFHNSWTFYNKNSTLPGDNEYCDDEDDEYSAASRYKVNLAVQPEHIRCQFYQNEPSITEAKMPELYLQDLPNKQLPLMMVVHQKDPRRNPHLNGLCVQWEYPAQAKQQHPHVPKFIQFYLEFFAPNDVERLDSGQVFLMRSKKFEMKYVAGADYPKKRTIKKCHAETDEHGIFTAIDKPADLWQRQHNYTIYPNKEIYRSCLHEYRENKNCRSFIKDPNEPIVVNPVVVIPGFVVDDQKLENLRFHSTRLIYDGCIGSKPCYSPLQYYEGLPETEVDCILSMSCELVWAVGKQPISPRDVYLPDPGDDEVVMELYAVSTAWAALGISEDKKIGEDYVLECVNENGTVRLYDSWNYNFEEYIGQSLHDNQRVGVPDKKVARLVDTKQDENSIYCMFYLKKSFKLTNPRTLVVHEFDLDEQSFCILTAYSDNMKYKEVGGQREYLGIGTHDKAKRSGKASCREFTPLITRYMPTRKQVKTLQTHGAILVVAYMGFLSTSLFVARYYKMTLNGIHHGLETWVWIHGVSAAFSVVLQIPGFALIVSGMQGWSPSLKSPFHQYTGYLCLILIICNLCIGCYIRRTAKIYEKSSLFYTFHDVVGHFSIVAVLFVLMLADNVEHAFIPCVAGKLAKIYVGVYFAIHVVMSFSRYWLSKLVDRREPLTMEYFNPRVLLTQNYNDEGLYQEWEYVSRYKIGILVLFILFAWSMSLSIAILIAQSDHSCVLENIYNKVHQQVG